MFPHSNPSSLPQLEMQYATYPGRWTTQEACGVTHRKTNVHVLVQSHKRNTVAHIQTHTRMYESVCLSSGCEVDRFAASGARGQRNFTTSRGLSGFSRWDLNTTETPNFLFGRYQRIGDPLSSKGCRHVRHSGKTFRNCRRLIQEGISHKELWFGQSTPSRGN